MDQLFKVLVDGASCHGGALRWSLPVGDKPGDWHEVEGELALCSRGLHFTDDPARWWKPGCRIFLVEADGVVGSCDGVQDRKVVARRGRLLREATAEELHAKRIFVAGWAEVREGLAISSDSAQVKAYGSAQVKAYGSAQVEAYGSAQVEAYDSAQVKASDSAQVKAYDSAQVEAYGSAQVEAYGSAQVEAYGSAQVEAYDSAQVEAYGSAQVEASDQVTVVSWWGSPAVKVMKRAVWVERGWGSDVAPKVHVAGVEPAAAHTKKKSAKRAGGRK